jgi:hypothetical protein
MATKVKQAAGAVERVLLPRLNSIDGDLKVVNTRIDGTHTRIDTLDSKIDSLKAELRTEMTSNKNEIKAEIRALSDKIDILPRLAILEAQMKEMQRKG